MVKKKSVQISTKKHVYYILILTSFLVASDLVRAKTQTCKGKAYNLKNERLLYTVTNTFTFEKDRHVETKVEYKNSKGELIVEETRSYRKHKTVPDVSLVDYRNSYKEGAELIDSKINLFNQRQAKEKRQQTITLSEPMVISAGIENLVKNYWNQLDQGEKIQFRYILPGKLDDFYLTIRKIKNKSRQRSGCYVFKIVAKNFLLRSVVKPIYLTFTTANKKLKVFEGYSNVLNEKGKRFRVKTIFSDNCL